MASFNKKYFLDWKRRSQDGRVWAERAENIGDYGLEVIERYTAAGVSRQLKRKPTCFADYVLAWMWHPESTVVAACDFSFPLFLMVVSEIIVLRGRQQGEEDDPHSNWRPDARQVGNLFSPTHGQQVHPIFDRGNFDRCCTAFKQRNEW